MAVVPFSKTDWSHSISVRRAAEILIWPSEYIDYVQYQRSLAPSYEPSAHFCE
jgi:hypothetical protein